MHDRLRYVNGVLELSVTETTLSSPGRAGVGMGEASVAAQSNTTGMHLDNFLVSGGATIATDSEGSNDGTYTNSPTTGVAGALTGDADTAVTFDGSDDYVTAARQVADDFSIECWFRSTQGIGTGTSWSQGAGLVDGDAAGTANDFGVSLRSDGKVVAGVGNPDTSIVSSSGGYDDDNWHHAVFTRKKSTGAIRLYVDGVSAGTATGNTLSLNASTNLSLGRIATGTGYFAGTLDDVAIYNAELTAADVAGHYATATSAETWTTSEAHDYKFQITLDNDAAAYGRSTTAMFRWEARNR